MDITHKFIYTAKPELQSGMVIADNLVNPMLASSMTPIEPASANPTQIWSFILSRVWVLGTAGMLLHALTSYMLLKRKVAAAIPVRQNIKRCEFIDSPFVLGFFFSVIYLSAAMLKCSVHLCSVAVCPLAFEEGNIKERIRYVMNYRKPSVWVLCGFLMLAARRYPTNEQWYLLVYHGGVLENPITVWLIHSGSGKHVDVTQGNECGVITDFIESQKQQD